MTEREIKALLLTLERLTSQSRTRPGCVVLRRSGVPEQALSEVDSWVNSRRGAILPAPRRWARTRDLEMRANAILGREASPDPGVYELPECELQS